MTTEPKEDKWPLYMAIAFGLAAPMLFVTFRFTAAVAFLLAVLLLVFYRLHRRRWSINLAFVLFFAVELVPIDVYVPGFHGPLMESKHSGPRLVRVLYGWGARPNDGDEAIDGGCVISVNDTRWMLVRD